MVARSLETLLAFVLIAGTSSREASPAEPATDVLVVGAGISGLSAALEAARGGASVRVVEMSSVFGGHAVMAHGGLCIVDTEIQRRQGIHDSPELAEADFLAWGEDASRGWVSLYARRSRQLVFDWLVGLGVRFSDRLLPFPGNSVPRFHTPEGRGLGLVSPIFRACLLHPGVDLRWDFAVDGLLVEHERAVGVEGASVRSGDRGRFRARHVVLATGGFQSNLAMVREFWPERFPLPERILVGSGVHSQGSGHRIAEAAGATLVNMDRQWNYATGMPDPRYPGSDRGLNASNGASLWVNLEGERFVNETASTKERLRALLRQRAARYWAIFDEPGKRRLFVSGSDWADFDTVEQLLLENEELVVTSDTLAGLARGAGLPAMVLERTVGRYNRMIAAGVDEDFHRFGFGGVPYDLAPGAEQGAVPVETPPFYALPFYPLARKSMGGVAIDLETRVLDRDGDPIPGLYAVGELAGFGGINGWAGLEGTFLGPSIVTGRIAATTLLAELAGERELTPRREPPAPEPEPPLAAGDSAECLECHDVDALLADPRPGYDHFEKVHRAVRTIQLACPDCHVGMSPFDPERHRIDRLAQIETCTSCHVAHEH